MSFKRAKVVMLPTNEKSKLVISFKEKSFNQLVDPKLTLIEESNYQLSNIQSQHLYILSDEPIKEGDWCLYNKNHNSKEPFWELFQCGKIEREEMHPHSKGKLLLWVKKIIATTDSSLWEHDDTVPYPKTRPALPQPSQSFIEKYVEEYNKGNIITDVLVEYEIDKKESYCEFGMYHKYLLKVNPKDNTITIKKVKDSWNRDEVKDILEKYRKFAWTNGVSRMDLEKWELENLL